MTPALPTVRVLLVDDDVKFVEYLQILLQRGRCNYEIDVAATVNEALHELGRRRHHVCLLDYRLGTEDGLEVLRRAPGRELRTPIILLTSEQDESLELTAIEQGAADYVNKSELEPRRLERTLLRAIARQRVENTLRERELRLADAEARALVMATHVGLDGQWLKVSPRFCELLGYGEEELLARRCEDVTHPDDIARARMEKQRLIHGATRSVEYEKRFIRKNGEIVWSYLNCSLVAGEDGAPLCYLMYVRDIGAEKRAEEALRTSEQRYSSMVRNAPYGIFEATRDGRFLHGNPALLALLGLRSEHALAQVDPDALYQGPGQRQRVYDRLFTPGRSSIETSWTRPDGSRLLVRISAEMPRDGAPVITGIVEDVTERKRLEERLRQAHKMQAVGQLAGGVAHDFNNLLTAILGYTEFLKEECAEMRQVQDDLEEVHKAAKSAAALTAQLLAFSRKQVLKTEVLSINCVIEGMGNLLSRVLGEDIALVTKLAPDAARVEADRVQLQQVLLNLAANARDAMPRGGRLVISTSSEVTVSSGPQGTALPPGHYAVITVSDNGCGMDRETQARIFEPFFTTKGQGQGTGLGLATVYGIVTQSGGEIICDTAHGAGTTFSIFLPATNKLGTVDVPAAAQPGDGTGTILLVEDRDDVRQLTRRILERRGYRVLDTGDATAAIPMAEETPIDLLLTDVVMPGMNGPELADRLRTRLPGVRVIFMSGFTGHSALKDTGSAPLIRKPFTPDGLAQKVREVIEQSPNERAVPVA
jgi:PAS domain S-box-containing protein